MVSQFLMQSKRALFWKILPHRPASRMAQHGTSGLTLVQSLRHSSRPTNHCSTRREARRSSPTCLACSIHPLLNLEISLEFSTVTHNACSVIHQKLSCWLQMYVYIYIICHIYIYLFYYRRRLKPEQIWSLRIMPITKQFHIKYLRSVREVWSLLSNINFNLFAMMSSLALSIVRSSLVFIMMWLFSINDDVIICCVFHDVVTCSVLHDVITCCVLRFHGDCNQTMSVDVVRNFILSFVKLSPLTRMDYHSRSFHNFHYYLSEVYSDLFCYFFWRWLFYLVECLLSWFASFPCQFVIYVFVFVFNSPIDSRAKTFV